MGYKSVYTAAAALLAFASVASAAPYPAPYFNGFENLSDVSTDGTYSSDDAFYFVNRVPSGTNGVISALGEWHAEASPTISGSPDGFLYTRFGGYSDTFPVGGYSTSIDIYLDTDESPLGADIRLDWSSAISTPGGTHRRDFIFSVGTDGAGGYVMSASNNAPGWPANPNRDPLFIADGGWYTFVHTFYDDGSGALAVDMSVMDADGNILKTWTLSDPADIIGTTVGGNRYGWLVNNGFNPLAIDNIIRTGVVAETKDDCKNGGWMNIYRADGTGFKNQGDCIQYVNTGK